MSSRAAGPKLCTSPRTRITPCSTPDVPRRLQIAPRPTLNTLYWTRITPCSVLGASGSRGSLHARLLALAPRTNYFVLDASSSAPDTDCSVLDTWRPAADTDCSVLDFPALCAARGLLRARHLTLRDGLRIAPYADTWRPALAADLSVVNTLSFAPDTDCSVFDTWRSIRLADFSLTLSLRPVLRADCSVLNT